MVLIQNVIDENRRSEIAIYIDDRSLGWADAVVAKH